MKKFRTIITGVGLLCAVTSFSSCSSAQKDESEVPSDAVSATDQSALDGLAQAEAATPSPEEVAPAEPSSDLGLAGSGSGLTSGPTVADASSAIPAAPEKSPLDLGASSAGRAE